MQRTNLSSLNKRVECQLNQQLSEEQKSQSRFVERTIPFGRPYIDADELDAVNEALGSPILTHGPKGKEFEKKFQAFMGGGYASTTSSCMASLHISSIYFGLGAGDEVIVPAQTHVATVHAIEIVGAKPIFVDCTLDTGNIDPLKIEENITSRTKAISLVHFAGIPADMDAIMEIARRHDLKVIEDCALAIGARYKGSHVGLIGDVGCFSFYPVKHITTAEGGMIVSKNQEVVAGIAHMCAFGVDRKHDERKIAGVYDVTSVGLNYRMSEIHASLGCSQMSKVEEILAKRKKNFGVLKKELSTVDDLYMLDSNNDEIKNAYYCAVLFLKNHLMDKRNLLINKLNGLGIGTSVYYPHPVPRLSYYRNKYSVESEKYKNATLISDSSVALPVGPHLNEQDMLYIAQCVKKCIKEL